MASDLGSNRPKESLGFETAIDHILYATCLFAMLLSVNLLTAASKSDAGRSNYIEKSIELSLQETGSKIVVCYRFFFNLLTVKRMH